MRPIIHEESDSLRKKNLSRRNRIFVIRSRTRGENRVSGVTEVEGALGIFGVGAPVDCCHCLTKILYLYRLENTCMQKPSPC